MNILNLFTLIYGKLNNYGMAFWVLAPLRRTTRTIANYILPVFLHKKNEYSTNRKQGLIISFTSFPARINDVWKVVECLKRQTILPEKIILWLSREQFIKPSMIPDSILERVDDLFEIRMVDEDIRSHKKYYYVMKEFPEKDFITCDDDIYYDPRMVERLITGSYLYPGCIIANHSKEISFDNNGQIIPYKMWKNNELPYSDKNRFQIGIGGVFYPKNSLHKMVLNKDLFMALTPLGDDIWLNAMARLNGTKVIQSGKVFLNMPIINNSPSLCSINNGEENMNDIQINNLRTYFSKHNINDIYKINM